MASVYTHFSLLECINVAQPIYTQSDNKNENYSINI